MVGAHRIGYLTPELGLWLDSEPLSARGFDHFDDGQGRR